MRDGLPETPQAEASFTRTYVLVFVVEAVVIAALYLLERAFS